MADGVSVGNMYIELGLDPKAMRSAIAQLSTAFGPLQRAAIKTGALIAGALGVGSVAGLVYLVKQSYDAAEAQWHLAGRLGTTVASLQTLQQVAKDDGIAVEALSKSIGTMNTRLAEAARTGKGPAFDALTRLGISAKEFIKLPVDERLLTLAKRFQTLGYSVDQQGEAFRALGVRGREMITILEGGGVKLENTRKQLQALGIELTDAETWKMAEAGDFFDDLGKAIDGVRQRLASALAPAVMMLRDSFNAWIMEQGGFKTVIESWVRAGIVGIGSIIDFTRDLIARWEELKNKGMSLLTMSGALAKFAYMPLQGLKQLATGLNEWDAAAAKVKASVTQAPSYKPWLDAFDQYNKDFEAKAQEAATKRAEMNTKNAVGLPGLTGEEAKAQSEKLIALKQSLANEAQAVDLHHQENLRKLAEFRKEGIATQAQYNELEAMAMEDFRKKQREWQWSSYGEAIATEQEQLARRFMLIHEKLAEGIAAQRITEEEGSRARIELIRKEGEERAQLMANQWSSAAGVVSNALSAISGLMEDEGEKGFTLMKGLAMAAAAVQQMGAIVAAYRTGTELGGPAVGTAFAAVATAATAAMLAKMAGLGPKSKGGASASGGRGGGGGGGGGGAQAQAAAPAQSMVISGFNANEWLKGDAVRSIVKQIVKFQNDGGRVIVQ